MMENTQTLPVRWKLDPPTSTDSGGPGSGQRKPPARPPQPTKQTVHRLRWRQ
jgi:hypothetical protein